MVAKMGVKMALLKVTVAGIGKLQNLCSNHEVCQGSCVLSWFCLGTWLCGVNSWGPAWSCAADHTGRWWGREEPLTCGDLTFWPVLASVFLQPPASNSWTRTLLCLLVDRNYAASPFRQGLCLPAYLSGISGAPVLIGAPRINNNHCQSRFFRAEQSEVIWLWKAPQSVSACCDPEMLAWKSITW